ncbi:MULTISPECIES: quinolinate synthase NadA [Deinococcus]|uniref:Quinolinate synthase n=1 Tax=Deinococcus geothermalis (strain DSM 11300 / CIP 105573 / AG-3a) TaxID=319795 RepID=Q1IZ73_DEIGD|nr:MULTISPECIES: quinolinate synthase NadA [Deinococcus]ABF45461.1 quinolinate synthetase complex, A subunit [Deinococcus geothermalis DSM 11300]MBI0445912.1 quinolinate synthase NadA [Deinococcus sp. DB0503]
MTKIHPVVPPTQIPHRDLLQLEVLPDEEQIRADIERLRRERNAVILAHNYQRPEVQTIADFVGDSLGLSRQAANTEAEVIVFAGVHFMAETAAILNPGKVVLLPDLRAGCSLADTLTAQGIRDWKARNPGGLVVTYVNTTADVKAESDYCCTSGNAVQIVRSLPQDVPVLFAPDRFLAAHVIRETGRQMDVWDGACHVHAAIRPEDVQGQQEAHPDAELLIHPECGCSSQILSAFPDLQLYSTEGMIHRARASKGQTFIVVTEMGMVTRLEKDVPGKTFVPVSRTACCEYMKMITLENIRKSLANLQPRVTVPEEIRVRALQPIERMLAIG